MRGISWPCTVHRRVVCIYCRRSSYKLWFHSWLSCGVGLLLLNVMPTLLLSHCVNRQLAYKFRERRSHVQALILNTSARDAWRRLPRNSAVSPAAIRPPGSSPEPPRPGWSPPPTLAGLQICRWWATDSLSKAIYVSEQVCIKWHSTGAYYTAKLTFSHDFPIKVWGAYYTSVRIIFEFLRYYTSFPFSILQIQHKRSWLYYWYHSPLQVSIFHGWPI